MGNTETEITPAADEAAFADEFMNGLDTEEPVEAGAAPEAVADGSPAAVETPAATEEAAPAWAPDPNEWQSVVETTTQLQQLLEQAYQPAPEEPFEIDPFDSESLAGFVQQQIQTGIQQALTPYLPAITATHEQQAKQTVEQWISEAAGKHASFDDKAKEAAAYVAGGFLPLEQGNGQVAVNKAAEYVAELQAHFMEVGKQAYLAELKAVSEAPTEPGTTNGSTEIVTRQAGEDELAIARRIAGRAQA